jgi:hypothetical protein
MRGIDRVSKVFLDSRYALPDGSIEIPGGGLLLQPTNRCWLAEFSTVASWGTIDSTNNILYVVEPGSQLRAVSLSFGVHDLDSLATEIQTKLNEGRTVLGLYTVQRVASGSGGSTSRHYRIINAEDFKLPREAKIRELFFNNSKLAVTNSTNTLFSFPGGDDDSEVHTSGFVDLRRCHSIYIHCPGFGAANTVGVTGARDILAKVPVDVGYGGSVHWYMSGSEHDSVEVGMYSLTVLKIELRDVAGNILNLQGSHWSATLIFDK